VKARAIGQLLRLSLSASALADVAAGIVLGAGAWPGGSSPFLLLAAGLVTYHGGMALNDWADREHDARTRLERPIPSGAVAPDFALALGLALLVLGPALAFSAGGPRVGWLALAVAGLALGYDLAPRGAWSGPLLLALCRAGNLATGIVFGLGAAPGEPAALLVPRSSWLWLAPAAYGAYVLVVSRLGLLEDREDGEPLGRRPSRLLGSAAALLFGPTLVAWALSPSYAVRSGCALLGAAAARGLVAEARRAGEWSGPRVAASMGLALRRLLVFTASFALAGGEPVAALAILAGYPLSRALRRTFPPS